jgi:hypothetical protein
MKRPIILCLSLGLTGCSNSAQYASNRPITYEPAVDLAACASSPVPPSHVDKLCNRQNANPYGN